MRDGVGAGPGPVVVDLRAVQSPAYRGRGIARRSFEEAAALERVRPDLVGAYLLDPTWPPPGAVDELLDTGKLCYLGTPQARAALEAAAVYHCGSPFELDRAIAQVRPPEVDRLGLRYAATLHDLIPLVHRSRYLAHAALRRRYVARLEVVRAADAVLAVSAAAAADAARMLDLEGDRLHVVGSGVSPHLAPSRARSETRAALGRLIPELAEPFIMFPGGDDARKNADRLIAAFGAMPGDLRRRYRLALVGEVPPAAAAHYRHLAGQAGVGDRLVLTGFVPDETLVQLYQATTLVAFPSLAEGFGLPVAEGLACGAVACVSDRPPLDELVPDARARFDPERQEAIAATMARCLTDDEVRASVRADAATTVVSWDTVAGRVAAVWDDMVHSPRRPWRRRHRPRVAVVSPFPPVPSGIAGYSAELVAAMVRVGAERGHGGAGVEIDCFADGRNRCRLDPEPVAGRIPRDAAAFERVDGAVGGYDRVVYVLGNSEYHANALGALRRRTGTVLAHEVRMSGLMALSGSTRGAVAPGGLAAAVARNYPGLPGGLGRAGTVDRSEAERYGLLLMKDVAADAGQVLVCSEAARRLALLDVGPALAGRIGVAPYAVAQLTPQELAAVGAARAARPDSGPPLIASFGIVDPSKRPETVVEAVAVLAGQGVAVRGALVGPVSEALAHRLGSLAESLGVADRVRVTGQVTPAEYLRLMGEATVAVQLRDRFSGECSGTVSECLSAAVPTVVAEIGWMAEIPRQAVVAVAPACSASELAGALGALVATGRRRRSLAEAGSRWAGRRTFDAAAAALLDALGLPEG